MCGICGIIPYGKNSIKTKYYKAEMAAMLRENLSRGKDATGVFRGGEKPAIFKANIPSDKFINMKEFQDFFNDNKAPYLGHTRKSTKGSPENNENNHPLIFGNYVVTHNGSIRNPVTDKTVTAEVDSIWFPWKLSQDQPQNEIEYSKTLADAMGSYALAIHDLITGKTFLVRDSVSERAIYYKITDDYVRYSQVEDSQLKELPPFHLLSVSQDNVEIKLVTPDAPFGLIDYIRELNVDGLTPQETQEKIIESIMLYCSVDSQKEANTNNAAYGLNSEYGVFAF